jgi:hypothetical protein
MIYAIASSVAEQASQAPVDYMPAIIGLAGVVVGGIIQVIAQTAKERAARVAASRADVMDFAQKAIAAVDNLQELEDIRKYQPARWAHFTEDELSKMSDDVVVQFKEMHRSGVLLAKVSDLRVAEYSRQVLTAGRRYYNARQGLFAWGADEESTDAHTHANVRREIDTLVKMVSPRKFERHLRFRSAKSAAKLLDA